MNEDQAVTVNSQSERHIMLHGYTFAKSWKGLPLLPVCNVLVIIMHAVGDIQHSDENGVKVKQGRFVCFYCGDSFYHAKRLTLHNEKEHKLSTGKNENYVDEIILLQ